MSDRKQLARSQAQQCVSKDKRIRRDLVINVLLIIAGIVLAFALFAAGAMWRSRMSARPARTSLNTMGQKYERQWR